MISTRGPNAVMVIDRTALPVSNVCDALIMAETVGEVAEHFGITYTEIMECIDNFCDNVPPRTREFLSLKAALDDDVLNIETVGLSDWVFFTLVRLGDIYDKKSDDLAVLFTRGLEEVVHDFLIDVANNANDYKTSRVHNIVADAFEEAYGTVDRVEATTLLLKLERDQDE